MFFMECCKRHWTIALVNCQLSMTTEGWTLMRKISSRWRRYLQSFGHFLGGAKEKQPKKVDPWIARQGSICHMSPIDIPQKTNFRRKIMPIFAFCFAVHFCNRRKNLFSSCQIFLLSRANWLQWGVTKAKDTVVHSQVILVWVILDFPGNSKIFPVISVSWNTRVQGKNTPLNWRRFRSSLSLESEAYKIEFCFLVICKLCHAVIPFIEMPSFRRVF